MLYCDVKTLQSFGSEFLFVTGQTCVYRLRNMQFMSETAPKSGVICFKLELKRTLLIKFERRDLSFQFICPVNFERRQKDSNKCKFICRIITIRTSQRHNDRLALRNKEAFSDYKI